MEKQGNFLVISACEGIKKLFPLDTPSVPFYLASIGKSGESILQIAIHNITKIAQIPEQNVIVVCDAKYRESVQRKLSSEIPNENVISPDEPYGETRGMMHGVAYLYRTKETKVEAMVICTSCRQLLCQNTQSNQKIIRNLSHFFVDKGSFLLYNIRQRFNMRRGAVMLFELKTVFLNEDCEQQLNYEIDLSDIDIDGVFPFTSPVAVTATARNRAGIITLTLDCGYDYSRCCDRCGEPFCRREQKSFEHGLAQELADEGNDDYIETPDFTVELDDIVISDILLDLPQKNLCKEDCKGLCPVCGQNLNSGSCNCSARTFDPRLEVLKQLMD